jgi:hypothetical protein
MLLDVRCLLLCLVACGRIDFNAIEDGSNPKDGSATGDSNPLGSISFVQVGVNSAQSVATLAAALPAVQRGDLLLSALDYSPQANTPTITDSQGNSYTVLGPFDGPGNPPNRQFLAYTFATATEDISCTATLPGSAGYFEMRLQEYAGVSTVAPVDVVAGAGGTTTGVDGVQVSLTTTGPNELLYALVIFEQGGVQGTGFTLRTGYQGDVSEDRQVPVAQTITATATMSMGSAWTISALALRPL